MSLTNALKWSFLSELASKAVAPIVFIILARLLTPEDFGVMTAALMVIGFSQIFWEAGMGKALIQCQTDVDDAANVAFWINIGLGIIIAGLLFFAAESIAQTFFHDNRVSDVIKVLTLQIFLGAASSVHSALLQKNMEFKKLFWVRFSTVTLPGVASIPLALNGMGYWALVAGTLAGQSIQMIILWQISPWRPKLAFHIQIAKEIGKFGAWVGASGLLAWFYIWADSLIVSMYFSGHQLGIYRTGNQFASMIFAILLGPIIPVLYSHLSKISIEKSSAQISVASTINILILFTIPTSMILFQISPNIETVIFGEKWNGLSFILGAFFLIHGFSWIVGMNGEFFRATGKPNHETIAMLVTTPIYLTIYIYFIKTDLHDFIIARFFAMTIGLSFQLYLASRLFKLNLTRIIYLIAKTSIIAMLCIYLIKKYVLPTFNEAIFNLFSHALIYIVICASTIFLFEKSNFIKIYSQLLGKQSQQSKIL